MQSKKRAKPVKFGEKNKTERKKVPVSHEDVVKPEEEIEVSKADKAEKAVEQSPDKAIKKDHGTHGLEAHISRTTETIDIKEISDDSDIENIPAGHDGAADSDESEEKVDTPTEEDNPVVQTESKNEEIASSDESSSLVASESADAPETSETEESESESESESDENEEGEDESSGEEVTTGSPIEKDGAFFNRPPDEYDQKKSSVPYFILIVVITFILGVVFFAGIYYAVQNKTITLPGSKNTAEITETPVIEVPTKKPVDLSKYTVRVLNGTATAGVAAKVKEQLTTEGFKVVSVGNATSSDIDKTEIAALKKVDKEYLNKLKETLDKTYVVDEVTELSTGSADVIVTIGSKSSE